MSLIHLSPIDYVFTGRGAYPIEFVFAYEGTIDAGRLEESLGRALAAFPPVGSRFVHLPDDSLAFEPYEGGCTFRVTESDTNYAETERRTAFLDPVDGRQGEPLGRVLLTRTPNGCVLGVSLSHAVADGYSYFYFLSSWARLFRGEPFPPPSHAREALVPPGDGPATTSDILDAGGLFRAGPRPEVDRAHLRVLRHVLSRTELVAMHEEAQAGNPVRLSHNDTAAAWLWKKCLVEWADPDPALDTYLSCPVDFRRIHPAVGLPTSATRSSSRRRRSREGSLPPRRSATWRRGFAAPSTPSTRRRCGARSSRSSASAARRAWLRWRSATSSTRGRGSS